LLSNIQGGSQEKKCGGLKNACNETTNICHCEKAYKDEGFKNTFDAISHICPSRKCKNVKKKFFFLIVTKF
jgi:hypothetical protein